MARRKWTAGEVVDALRRAYLPATDDFVTEEWSLLTEVPLRAPRPMHGGHVREGYWGNTRTIDVLLVRNWSSGIGHRRIAVEVKVSRSDYRNETDQKRAPAELAAHHTYYAAPAGLIDVGSLPHGWGLIEVYATAEEWAEGKGWEVGASTRSRVRVRKRPVLREPGCDLDYLVAAGFRRASRAEERIRRGADDAAAVPGLRREVESLTAKLERRDSAVSRLRGRLADARSLVAGVEGAQVCADCGHAVALDGRTGMRWVHVDQQQERVCEEARAEANRLEREAAYGTRYMRGWPDPVEPKSLRDQRLSTQGEHDATL